VPTPQVFVTRQIFPEALEMIAREARLEVWPDDYPPSPEQLRRKLAQADGVLTNIMDRLDAAAMAAAPNLKIISQMAVGVDNIDLAEATRRGIPVGHTPGVLAKATADLTFALLMAAARRVSESDRWVRRGQWQLAFHPMHWLGVDIHGATLGILGLGQIGLEVARRARGFEMKLMYHSRTRRPQAEAEYGLEYAALPEVLAAADFVTVHVPLTAATRHYIGERELRMMKPSAILVNVARGPVVDAKALYKVLKEGGIRAAALDVTDPEPIPADDPLLSLENLLVTPHIGSASVSSRRAMCLMAARNLLAGLKGQRLEACANGDLYQVKNRGC